MKFLKTRFIFFFTPFLSCKDVRATLRKVQSRNVVHFFFFLNVSGVFVCMLVYASPTCPVP